MKKKRPPVLKQELTILFGLEKAPEKEKQNSPLYLNAKQPKNAIFYNDEQLWESITQAIVPLKKRDKRAHIIAKKEKPALPALLPHAEESSEPAYSEIQKFIPQNSFIPLPSFSLGRDMLRDIGRGKRKIRNKIDLHGMQQNAAYHQLGNFLKSAQFQDERVVLVITGKGKNSGSEAASLLRRLVPLWLESAEFKNYVSAYSEAHIHHGGGGALYVHIKKPVK